MFMKLFFLLITSLQFAGWCQSKKPTMISKELFIHTDSHHFQHSLLLEKSGDSLRGFYTGAEHSMNQQPVYYLARLKDITRHGNSIGFVLKQLQFSHQPVDIFKQQISPIEQKDTIPLILQLSLYFNGTINGDTIRFNRVSDLYDSRADEMVFIKQ
jgi:hypothetical protein